MKSWDSKWSLLEWHREPGLQQGGSKGRLGVGQAMVVAGHDAGWMVGVPCWCLTVGLPKAMEQAVKREAGGFASLVSAALEERSLSVSAVWQLLLAVREPAPLNLLMEEIRKQPGAEFFFQAGNGLGVPPCSP